MENKSLLWKSSVNKAFYGYLAYTLLGGVVGAIVSLASGAAGVASLVSGGSGASLAGPIIVSILALAGYVYYYLGIKGMRDSAVDTQMAEGTANVYKGAMLGLVGVIVKIIPVIGFVGTIISIIGFIYMMMGFNKLRKLSLTGLAAKGAQQLWLMMVLTIVGAVLGFIPLAGSVLKMICSLAVLFYTFFGWKNFSNSELE